MRALYVGCLGELGSVDDPRLDTTTERHRFALKPVSQAFQGPVDEALERAPDVRGVIFEMDGGIVGRDRLGLIKQLLGRGMRVWLYWRAEDAVECVDAERLRSAWRHWWFAKLGRLALRLGEIGTRFRALVTSVPPHRWPIWFVRRLLGGGGQGRGAPVAAPPRRQHQRLAEIESLLNDIRPAPMTWAPPTPARPLDACGVYLRTDFWTRIESGGSYGHTCYVAKELAAVCARFVCLMPHRYKLLDEYGINQVVIEPPVISGAEDTIVDATPFYVRTLRPVLQALRPAFIYERLCLGNYAGAALSRELGIPYLVEYNGSEISMRRSFDGTGYLYENEYLKAEMAAFRQATLITVVSAEVRNGLIARGVDAGKILVNPNGADLDTYAPPAAAERDAVRGALGFGPEHAVIGFTGTFGGWHGIDVLAEAIPRICADVPSVRFLLIGDGNYKHLVDAAVERNQLQDRVRFTGRVPQAEGARLLKACDLFVSPHNSHMVDSRFFGSPTKIFEYMSMGGAIVASDLEQIGEVLSPALRLHDLTKPPVHAGAARSVLCEPGNVDEFVQAVTSLVRRPELWPALGRNARAAVEQHYSWAHHVARLWTFDGAVRPEPPRAAGPAIVTGDRYKDEVQRQWDNDPAGSHYVKDAQSHTPEWFREVEAYRYGTYAPWMAEVMEFDRHAGKRVLEIGGGIGTDLAQFAKHGALTTDLDLSAGHLALARENFQWRGLPGEFIHHDAETLPFEDRTFDVVYSNGVIHHTPNTGSVVQEIRRVLKPGGKAIVMVYAENSLHYWRNLVWAIGMKDHHLDFQSMGEIMSRAVERSDNAGARPLVKVYTPERLRAMFEGFTGISIVQRQMLPEERPRLLSRVPLHLIEHRAGWNLIIKARRPGG